MSFVKSVFDVDMDTFNTRAPLDESLGPTNPLVRAGMSNMRISLSGGPIPKPKLLLGRSKIKEDTISSSQRYVLLRQLL